MKDDAEMINYTSVAEPNSVLRSNSVAKSNSVAEPNYVADPRLGTYVTEPGTNMLCDQTVGKLGTLTFGTGPIPPNDLVQSSTPLVDTSANWLAEPMLENSQPEAFGLAYYGNQTKPMPLPSSSTALEPPMTNTISIENPANWTEPMVLNSQPETAYWSDSNSEWDTNTWADISFVDPQCVSTSVAPNTSHTPQGGTLQRTMSEYANFSIARSKPVQRDFVYANVT